jgi:hypothetical protein
MVFGLFIKEGNFRNYFAFYITTLLILISGFRYNLGLDTLFYTAEFETFPKLADLARTFFSESNYQPLWILFVSTVRSLNLNFYVVQFALAIFVNFSLLSFLTKYSVSVIASLLFYFIFFYFNLNMEILRESVCIAIFLLSFPFLLDRKVFIYHLLFLIAFFFHESAIIMPFAYFFFGRKLNKRFYILVPLIVLGLSSILAASLKDLIFLFEFLFVKNKLNYFEVSEEGSSAFLFNLVKYVFIPYSILILFHDDLIDWERKSLFLYLIFSILFLNFFIFYRIRDYFFIFYIVLFTNLIYRNYKILIFRNGPLIKIAMFCLFIFLNTYRFYYIPTRDAHYQVYLNYFPYTSIFTEKIPDERTSNRRFIY